MGYFLHFFENENCIKFLQNIKDFLQFHIYVDVCSVYKLIWDSTYESSPLQICIDIHVSSWRKIKFSFSLQHIELCLYDGMPAFCFAYLAFT